MQNLRIYISGPMTGYPEFNFPAFNTEAARLRDLGHDVVNPAELHNDDFSWDVCMRQAITALVTCNAIQLLPCWHDSKGAQLEFHIALKLGITIYMPYEGGLI